MFHAKVMVVDDVLAVVGSANFDNRSLELNDELSVAALDPGLTARLLTDMERDITRSRKLDWRTGARVRCTSARAINSGVFRSLLGTRG